MAYILCYSNRSGGYVLNNLLCHIWQFPGTTHATTASTRYGDNSTLWFHSPTLTVAVYVVLVSNTSERPPEMNLSPSAKRRARRKRSISRCSLDSSGSNTVPSIQSGLPKEPESQEIQPVEDLGSDRVSLPKPSQDCLANGRVPPSASAHLHSPVKILPVQSGTLSR